MSTKHWVLTTALLLGCNVASGWVAYDAINARQPLVYRAILKEQYRQPYETYWALTNHNRDEASARKAIRSHFGPNWTDDHYTLTPTGAIPGFVLYELKHK